MYKLPTTAGAVFAFALLLIGCTSPNMPAITEQPTGSSLPGKIVWHDLITDTPEQTKTFYGELFGWEFEAVDTALSANLNYTLIRNEGRLIGGMVDQNLIDTQKDISQWVALISVEDVDSAVAVTTANGGRVITPPLNLADRGRIAVIADPQGAIVTLLQSNAGDPLDGLEVASGGFLWNELWTDAVGAAAEFYQALVGFEIVAAARVGQEYRVMKSQGQPRAGIMAMPVDDVAPIWVPYLRVTDDSELDAVVARVEKLGGSILLDPQDRQIGGRAALIAGPSGAGIALQTWPIESGSGG